MECENGNPKCWLYRDGRCAKFDARRKCTPSDMSWFDEEYGRLQIIEPAEMCKQSSIFGNNFFLIDDEQLEALKQGKVLFDIAEYGTFIALKRSIEADEDSK